MPPQPQAVSGDGDGDGHGEEDPKVGRGDGGAWFGVEGECVVHAEEGLGWFVSREDRWQFSRVDLRL